MSDHPSKDTNQEGGSMAKASVETVEIQPAVPAVVEERITLTLSRDEAEALLSLVGKCSVLSPVAPMYYAIQGAGVKRLAYKVTRGRTGQPLDTVHFDKRGD